MLKHSYMLLVLLLVTDFLFIVLYGLYGFDVLSDPKFGIIEDWSYGEVFQYIKELWIVLLLTVLAVRFRSPLYFAWGLLFAYLLVDDSAQLHERLGAWVAGGLEIAPRLGLRSVDFGEMMASAAAGLVLLGGLAIAHWRADQRQRWISRRLFFLLLGLVFCGVVVDMVPRFDVWLLEKSMDVLEDGGEHVMMSLIVWFTYVTVHEERAR